MTIIIIIIDVAEPRDARVELKEKEKIDLAI